MAESFALSVQVVVPLVVFMGVGSIIRKRKWMSSGSVKEMNDVVFKVLLSTMVFYNIYQSDLAEDFDLGLLRYAVAALFLSFASPPKKQLWSVHIVCKKYGSSNSFGAISINLS